jgi:hypothetical protein
LIDEGEVDEVVVGLPSSSMVLNIIGKSRAFNERVHVFTIDEVRIVFLQGNELLDSRSENSRVVHGKQVLCNVSNSHMAIDRVSGSSTDHTQNRNNFVH